jgi:hypothetical protein
MDPVLARCRRARGGRRNGETDDLGLLVPAAYAQRPGEMRLRRERLGLGLAHRPALQLQRQDRGGREFRRIARLGRDEIALRVDMEGDRSDDRLAEMPGQKGGAHRLVLAVDAARGDVLVEPVQQMADVVQQRRDDQFGGRALRAGERRGLQRMIALGHAFPIMPVRFRSLELGDDAIDDVGHLSLPFTRVRRI